MSYEAELAQAHMERRRRLWGEDQKSVPEPPPPPPPPEPPELLDIHEQRPCCWLRVSVYKATSDEIKDEVAKTYGITVAQLTSHKRLKEYVCARRELFYRLRTEMPHLSLGQIGRISGGFDHSTVLHGIDRYLELGPIYHVPSASSLSWRKINHGI